MKEKLKKILIVVGVIFVVYYLWKKGVFSKNTTAAVTSGSIDYSDTGATSSDPDQFAKDVKAHDKKMSDIASKLGLTTAERDTFLNLTHNIYVWNHDNNEDDFNLEEFVQDARESGRTLNENYAYSALWAMSPKGWAYGKPNLTSISQKRFDELRKKL